ncbi:MAG: fructosamine kinase family protein, partial [Saprospiraceae bacterium]|nr:fructosamine kinase family protein [Saprospiraceae bacterium]
MLPPSLHNHLDSTLPARIRAARPLSGGDIHRAYRLELENGQNIFIKTNQNRQAPEMFRTES